MHTIPRRPLPKSLPIEVKEHATRAKRKSQTHVQHNRPNKTDLLCPRRDELAEAIAPDVLIDGNSDEDAAGDGLVRVNAIGAADGGDGGDLDAGAGIANYHDSLDRRR